MVNYPIWFYVGPPNPWSHFGKVIRYAHNTALPLVGMTMTYPEFIARTQGFPWIDEETGEPSYEGNWYESEDELLTAEEAEDPDFLYKPGIDVLDYSNQWRRLGEF